MRPVKIRLDKQARQLVIEWDDGLRHRYPWTYLRAHCPSAGERVSREQPNTDPLAVLGRVPSSDVADVRMVGNYAINLTWADGHNAGIYSWEYLRSLIGPSVVEESTSV